MLRGPVRAVAARGSTPRTRRAPRRMDGEHLLRLSKEQLIEMLLKERGRPVPAPIIAPPPALVEVAAPKGSGKKKRGRDSFDWSKHELGQVALKIAYCGWDYFGFASQADAELPTIEARLFEALETSCLVQSRKDCKYSRCGRTDRGVSAFGQVIGLHMRRTPASLDIAHTLNRLLPQDIRVLAWAPVAKHFNARYDCLYRTYKYFFPRENLNIDAMRQAAQQYVGDHDYRNFCKMDAVNVANFRRVVLSVDISRSSNVSPGGPSPYELYEYNPSLLLSALFTVCGYAFLWHQVRCMVEILFRVGRGEESPDIVSKLLDPASFARGKPVYALASELPLVLWECGFEEIEWRHSDEASRWIDDVFASRWREQAMRYGLAQAFRSGLDQSTVQMPSGNVFAWSERKLELPASVRKPGQKILEGPREQNYEEKIATMSDKKRQQFEAKRQNVTAGDEDE